MEADGSTKQNLVLFYTRVADVTSAEGAFTCQPGS
jgi:hypothetical protein